MRESPFPCRSLVSPACLGEQCEVCLTGPGQLPPLPCAHTALTWAQCQPCTSAAILTLSVPLPKPLELSGLGFPLGKKKTLDACQPCLPLCLQQLLPQPHLQKLHSAPCKPTLTFSSEFFSRSWMRTQPFPAPIAMENHEAGSEEEHWVNTSQLYLKHLIQTCFDKSCSCFQ